jgi:hypothetical protein
MPGTYVGLRVLDPANALLYAHCVAADINVKRDMFERRLHTTVIYSRTHCPGIETSDFKHIGKFKEYAIFGKEGERILVALLDAPSVVRRHEELMARHSATYDFPEYHPHVTLSYDFEGDIRLLKPLDFHIILGEEYVEDLDTDWKE